MSIPVGSIPSFDELYVISDLHLGGDRPDFQIFNAGEQLERLISYLTARPGELRVALLINGDLVDFLAEEQAQYFDPLGAVAKLNRIAHDPSFVPVWSSLQQLVGQRNRTLILNLGNHDLELALPWVRARLLEILTGGDPTAYPRIVLAFEGTGFRCRVGEAEILCVHGNEVDDWNRTDHEKIRRIGRDLTQGKSVQEWIPNAGTRLVIDIMNSLKRTRPFIDLLKPEVEAVVPILLAMETRKRDKVLDIAGTARQWVTGKVRHAVGLLGDEEPEAEEMRAPTGVRGALGLDRERYAEELLRQAEIRIEQRVDPMTLIPLEEQQESLGSWKAIRKWWRGEGRAEVLREFLDRLRADRSFDLSYGDETFQKLDAQMGEADFLVAGHTHLERALPRARNRGFYFNTGAWVRLIRLAPEVLEDAKEFGDLYKLFQEGGAISRLDEYPDLVRRCLTVAAFRRHGDGYSYGELLHVGESGGAEPFLAVPGSRYPKDGNGHP